MLGFSFRRGMSETGLIKSRNKQFSEAKKKEKKRRITYNRKIKGVTRLKISKSSILSQH
jgi:hypothetical protein